MSKYALYSCVFCPFSRKVRFFLDENCISYENREIRYWEKNADFLRLNPLAETPVLKNIETNEIICDSFLICEYLTGAEIKKNLGSSHFDLLCLDTPDEYEVKRLQMLFDKNFFNAVTGRVIEEIFINTFQKKGKISNSDKIMAALNNFERHVKYIEFLLGKRKYLGGESFSIADISAAAQISVLDYLGMADWEKHEKFKEWYISIKQKIGFRKILEDKISGFEPNVLYNKLDF